MFLVVTIFYGGTWLALAMVFSTVFRQPATAALASIAAWLIMLIFWSMLANLIVNAAVPIRTGSLQEAISRYQLGQALMQPSPNTLFVEAMAGLLYPDVRSFGIAGQFLPQGAVIGAPLPLGQSIGLIWPQLAGLIALTTLTFALSYVLFQRQEIRA
jgi:ABC-2 type transport system permease protein